MNLSQALPAQIFNTSFDTIDEETSKYDINLTDPKFLFEQWKGYYYTKNTGNDLRTSRTCNLFWRIWTKQSLSDNPQTSLSNVLMNELWQRCQDDHEPLESINSDPVLMIRLSPALRRIRESEQSRSSTPGVSKGESDLSSTVSDDVFRNPPASHLHSSQASGSKAAVSGSSRVSPNAPAPCARPQARRTTSGSKGRVPTVSTVGRGRTKPALPRRKSNQSRPQHETSVRSPKPAQATLFKQQTDENEDENSATIPAEQRRPSNFELGSPSSWQSEEESSSGAPSKASSMAQEPATSLVDPGFRSRFAEQQRTLTSSTNLAAAGRKAAGRGVRFSTDEPEEIGKGKGVAARIDGTTKEAYRSHERKSSQAVSDSEDSGTGGLTRVPSQLSMMIKDHKRQSGSQDLGPPSPAVAEQGRTSESKKKEEELLKMGRNAAKPTIPKPKKEFRDPGYQSPDERTTF